ncbi:MAG TPA: proteasome activator [Actinomycetota bacterium]|nr:proteasome activator [Actinomycetota bacterium]
MVEVQIAGEGGVEVPEGDRPLDPERLLRLAGLVRAVLEEARQMDPDQATAAELAALHDRVTAQAWEALPNSLRSELEAIDLTLPWRDRAEAATPQEVRVAYSGLIGWLGGLFQGLQAAVQYQQMQALAQLGQGGGGPGGQIRPPGIGEPEREHPTGQYL